MRPASIIAFAAFAVILALSTSFVRSAYAVNYTTPLKAGDTGNYSLFGSYAHGTVNAQLKISSVTSTNITASLTDYPPGGYANGGGPMWIDVFSGAKNNFTSNVYFAVAGGLKQGDFLFNGWTNVTVQGVTTQPCGGVNRQIIGTNYFRFGELVNIAWDQNTGIICNYGANDQHGGILGLTLDNTTLWNIPSPADVYVVGAEVSTALGLPLVILILYIYVRRRRRKRRSR